MSARTGPDDQFRIAMAAAGTADIAVCANSAVYGDIVSLQKVMVTLYTFLPLSLILLVSKVGNGVSRSAV